MVEIRHILFHNIHRNKTIRSKIFHRTLSELSWWFLLLFPKINQCATIYDIYIYIYIYTYVMSTSECVQNDPRNFRSKTYIELSTKSKYHNQWNKHRQLMNNIIINSLIFLISFGCKHQFIINFNVNIICW